MATTRLTFHTEIAKSFRAARVASRLDDGRRAALALRRRRASTKIGASG